MDKIKIDELIKAFELCKQAIKLLHPMLNPDEPCIAWEAFEEADYQIAQLKNLTNRRRAAESCPFCDCAVVNKKGYCVGCGKLVNPPPD